MEKEKIDLTTAKDIVKEQQFNLRKAIPQSYLFNFVFGTAWIVGYGAIAFTGLSKLGYIIFALSLIVATIISMLYLIKTLKGVKTVSSKYMAWWGISWWVGFIMHVAIMNSLRNILVNESREVFNQISWSVGNSIPLLIVSLCFLGGATIFKRKELGLLGILISLVTAVSANLTPVKGATLCAIAGVVMILFAVLDFYRSRKAR